jgi:FixJ family two-component response regulator
MNESRGAVPGDPQSRAVVAVVDDDHRVLESLDNLLASVGYVVRLYPSGEEFLAARILHEVDCLISDIGMPGMSGVELLRVLRREAPDLPVILITARQEERTLAAGREMGASHIFRKPFNGAEVLQVTRDLIAGRGGRSRRG